MITLHSRQEVTWGEFPAWRDDPQVVHAFSTRRGGISDGPLNSLNLGRTPEESELNLETNRRRFLSALSIAPQDLVHAVQVHGSNVVLAREPGVVQDCDGLITDRAGLYLVIGVADCHVVFLASRDAKVVGALHDGWRGIVGGILSNAVSLIQQEFDYTPEDLRIAISPGIGVCCYEVGPEVADQFPQETKEHRDGHWFADLNRALLLRARQLGIPENHTLSAQRCTSCEPDNWFSYRRDGGTTGRMWGIIGRKGE